MRLRSRVLDGMTAADQARSMRSAFITFVQAATKSLYELLLRVRAGIHLREARSCECEPKMRSTRVPGHLTAFVLRSRPSYTPSEAATAYSTCSCRAGLEEVVR